MLIHADKDVVTRTIEHGIFGSRLFLVPIYGGVILALAIYMVKFFCSDWGLIISFSHMDEGQILLSVLSLLDQMMVASLIVMLIIGSYTVFISELKFEHGASKPQWLSHVSAGTLETKMGSSIVGVSSIDLLRAFINAEHTGWETVEKKIAIHIVFVISTLALWYIAKDDFAHVE